MRVWGPVAAPPALGSARPCSRGAMGAGEGERMEKITFLGEGGSWRE